MTELSEVYGTTFQQEAKDAQINYIINLIVNNVAHRQFNFRLFDSLNLWKEGQIPASLIQTIINKVKESNNQLHIFYLDKKSPQINMLPSLIIDSPVEYFWIIDAEKHRAYFIYITPYEVNAF